MSTNESNDEQNTLLNEYKTKIQHLEAEVQIALKKLSNAKALCAAQEKAAREAKAKEVHEHNQCQTYKYKFKKAQEKLDVLERRLKIKHLQRSCDEIEKVISEKHSRCAEIEFDDQVHLPIHTDKRIELTLLKKSLDVSESIYGSRRKLLETLVERQNLDAEMKRAAIEGNVCKIKELIDLEVSVNSCDETGLSPFKYACGQGHVDAVREMIPVADINNKDGRWSPLHIALENCQYGTVSILIGNNADVDDPDETGEFPLHIACRKSSLECVASLVLDGGAYINVQNKLGDTCLHYCAKANLYEIASFLLENGADSRIKNADGLIPFTIAKTKRKYDVVKVFNSHVSQD